MRKNNQLRMPKRVLRTFGHSPLYALSISLFIAGCGSSSPTTVADLPAAVDYNWHVRPILAENCLICHGFSETDRKAGFRLDVADSAFAELPESPGKFAIVPGDPDASELIRRITAAAEDVRMPPPESHKESLSESDVAILERWIAGGAEYKPHWAFIPLSPPMLPKSPFAERVENAIDLFVHARLPEIGLEPAAQASPETLVNRVFLALTGLPPTLEEVDAFIEDTRDDAYENLVDRLLQSPNYGERMATEWLDVARYAESDGFFDDVMDRTVYPWRDWVINAFNTNMPYDEFSRWQLAGDLLPNATQEQILATAFGRLGQRSTENGVVDEEYRVEYALERTQLVGTAFVGLSVGCARCHDHKYDPIAQKDFYALSGFFNSIDERGFYSPGYSSTAGPSLLYSTDDSTQTQMRIAREAVAASEARHDAALAAAISDAQPGAAELAADEGNDLQQLIESALSSALVAYYPFDSAVSGDHDSQKIARRSATGEFQAPRLPAEFNRTSLDLSPSGMPGQTPAVLVTPQLIEGESSAAQRSAILNFKPFVEGFRGQAFQLSDTNIGYLQDRIGWYERTEPFAFSLQFKAADVYGEGVIVNHMDHDYSGGFGYSLNLRENHLVFEMVHTYPNDMFSIEVTEALPVDEWVHIAFTYNGSSRAAGARIFVNGREMPVRVSKDRLTKTALPQLFAGPGRDFLGFGFGKQFRRQSIPAAAIDELRIFGRELTPLEVHFSYSGDVKQFATGGEASAGVAQFLAATQNETVTAARRELLGARNRENVPQDAATPIMVMGDAPEGRPTYVLARGTFDSRSEQVAPEGLSQVLEWDEAWPRNRLGLTEWLFDRENPLTARVFVNRLWYLHFGRGLVDTIADFGTQGATPSHPELLDWLATEFTESGWDIKYLNKLMVMSGTFRQGSDFGKDALTTDPENIWLARGSRTRLPAEMIRDSALAASGLLVTSVGGPSVHPYQPPGLWENSGAQATYSYPDPNEVPADEHHRRSLYTVVKRKVQVPSMAVFDFADRNTSTVQRNSSSSPLQALVLLNDPQYLEAYRKIAERVLETQTDIDSQIKSVFRLAARRSPTDREISLLREYYESEYELYSANREGDVDLILAVGVSAVAAVADPAALVALASVAGAVMNTPDAYSIH
jgi:hypothetical protein